jgi:hypothetical protein
MRRSKGILAIIIIFIVLFLVYQSLVFLYMSAPWVVPWMGNFIIANPPRPENEYGEFPFRLTYELNGEIIVIEDVVICEFDGFELLGEAGKYRKWKVYLKSGKNRITLLDLREINESDQWGNKILEFYFDCGNAEYYMNDFSSNSSHGPNDGVRSIDYIGKRDGKEIGSAIPIEDAFEKYGLKILSVERTPPIQNTFK